MMKSEVYLGGGGDYKISKTGILPVGNVCCYSSLYSHYCCL